LLTVLWGCLQQSWRCLDRKHLKLFKQTDGTKLPAVTSAVILTHQSFACTVHRCGVHCKLLTHIACGPAARAAISQLVSVLRGYVRSGYLLTQQQLEACQRLPPAAPSSATAATPAQVHDSTPGAPPSDVWSVEALLATAGCVALREVLQALADALLINGPIKQQLLQGALRVSLAKQANQALGPAAAAAIACWCTCASDSYIARCAVPRGS
jgi:hypothetical protein